MEFNRLAQSVSHKNSNRFATDAVSRKISYEIVIDFFFANKILIWSVF